MWLMAGREITEDEPRMSDGDAITFKMRVAVLVYFGVMQVSGTQGSLYLVGNPMSGIDNTSAATR
eukprot:1000558-Rhodomonas_salina.1